MYYFRWIFIKYQILFYYFRYVMIDHLWLLSLLFKFFILPFFINLCNFSILRFISWHFFTCPFNRYLSFSLHYQKPYFFDIFLLLNKILLSLCYACLFQFLSLIYPCPVYIIHIFILIYSHHSNTFISYSSLLL